MWGISEHLRLFGPMFFTGVVLIAGVYLSEIAEGGAYLNRLFIGGRKDLCVGEKTYRTGCDCSKSHFLPLSIRNPEAPQSRREPI
jgi:hypothetical protein